MDPQFLPAELGGTAPPLETFTASHLFPDELVDEGDRAESGAGGLTSSKEE